MASRDIISHNFELVSQYLNSVLETHNIEHSTSFTSPANDEDAMYEEYRDELALDHHDHAPCKKQKYYRYCPCI